jgi:nucleoside phosphorylase
VRGRIGRSDIAILTITDPEFQHAKHNFETHANISGEAYFVQAVSPIHDYSVVMRRAADRSNVPATRATKQIIEDWRPRYIFLVGTAGGVLSDDNTGRDGARLGDVVVADYIEYVEFAKLDRGRAKRRCVPHDQPSTYLRESYVERLRYEKGWQSRICVERPDRSESGPNVIVGNIAAGEHIFSDPSNESQRQLIEDFDKVVAFETESFGLAVEICSARNSVHYNPQYLTIRGLSDFVNATEPNSERLQWTPYACCAASAFAKGLADNVLEIIALADPQG